jgi:hypothetical protein
MSLMLSAKSRVALPLMRVHWQAQHWDKALLRTPDDDVL